MPEDKVVEPGNDAQPLSVEEQVEWKPPASQAELDRIITDRIARATRRFKDYDAVKEKAGRLDSLEHELSSETDKQVRAARDEERKQADERYVPRLVKAEFRANRGALTDVQLDALLEDLNLSRYIGEDGEPDVDKIRAKVSALAPEEPRREPFPDLGGGDRGSAPPAVDMNHLIRTASGRG